MGATTAQFSRLSRDGCNRHHRTARQRPVRNGRADRAVIQRGTLRRARRLLHVRCPGYGRLYRSGGRRRQGEGESRLRSRPLDFTLWKEAKPAAVGPTRGVAGGRAAPGVSARPPVPGPEVASTAAVSIWSFPPRERAGQSRAAARGSPGSGCTTPGDHGREKMSKSLGNTRRSRRAGAGPGCRAALLPVGPHSAPRSSTGCGAAGVGRVPIRRIESFVQRVPSGSAARASASGPRFAGWTRHGHPRRHGRDPQIRS